MSANAIVLSRETTVGNVLNLLRGDNTRLVSIFGSLVGNGRRQVHYIVDVDNREYLTFHAPVDGPVESATPITPAAAWYERELHDQYGVEIQGHPDLRPLMLHGNWPEGVFPMAQEMGAVPWAQRDYPFLTVAGVGVCEVPVGPVHAGIIEPGHFRFSVVGDTVLHLELRHFYTHKGTEKLFEGADFMNGVMLAESVSGDNCFAHAVAYCQAIENACGISAPPRGQAVRLVGLELERLLAHIADVGALCGDVGFPVPAAYNARIKESLLQTSARLFGTRCWKGIAIPGGVKGDLTAEHARELSQAVRTAAGEFAGMAATILNVPSVQNRFESTGILRRDLARALAVVGPVARASGVRIDVRRNHPYGLYRKFQIEVPHYHYGDVLARARIRMDEAAISARLIEETLAALPAGETRARNLEGGTAEGFSAVESPRGELLYWIRIRDGRIVRCHIKSPSFQNWPALPLAMPGNIIADFPLINKSFNLSYSGCDR
jgi:Ni,Fe-hydrogenase III large subunit/Ni,Fe-hydrogenase III component G